MISRIYYRLLELASLCASSVFGLFVSIAYPQPTKYAAPTGQPVEVTINFDQPIATVSDKYLSFAVDTSKALGGYWWGSSGVIEIGRGKEKRPPLDYTSEKLATLTKALSPAYLRIGGTEADRVLFDTKDAVLPLTTHQWDSINTFAQKAGLDLFFTTNAGPQVRDTAHNWTGTNFEKLLAYSRKKGYKLAVFELGNELNAYWFFHGLQNRITPRQYSKDFTTFAAIAKKYYPAAKVAGGASLYWPRVGEAFSFVGSFLPKLLMNTSVPADIFTWHYYPQQSQRSPIRFPKARHGLLCEPRYLNDLITWAKKLDTLKRSYHPHAELWIGEIGNALCGGQPTISDTFESSFWWIDTLGSMARHGQKVLIRQDLVGSDYSMIDEKTGTPRPDFWVSLVWKKLMGPSVFAVQRSRDNDYIRIYAHTAHSTLGKKNMVTIVCINLQDKKNCVRFSNIDINNSSIYQLTSDSLHGSDVMLNSKPLRLVKGALPPLVGNPLKTTHSLLELTPLSITFLVAPYAQ